MRPLTIFKAATKRIFGEPFLGAVEFFIRPDRRQEWGGPFNGQPLRQALFQDLVSYFEPCALIETGTYRGATTQFFADTGLPVFSIEANPRNYGFARARLWHFGNVQLFLDDSRRGLSRVFAGPARPFLRRNLFFYLDAHWGEHLPLFDELQLILGECLAPVIMIDDFKVPNDAGYEFDDYGPGKSLTLALIEPLINREHLSIFFPTAPAEEEGGARRGCVVLARPGLFAADISGLRRWDRPLQEGIG